MKSGISLVDMAKEIQRQADLKADYMLDTRSLRLEPFDSKLYLNAYDQSGVPALEPLEVNSIAHRQIGTHLKIPAAYYDKMLEEYPQLLAQNVNAWFQREPSVRMIRTIEGTARAFLSNRYRRIDNLDIASIVLPVLGIDLIAIGRAAWNNLTTWSLREGGSTITQQLAKNMYFTQEKSFIRKVAEMFVAFQLEHTYTKDEILELYVNSIYFGDGYYGIGDACKGYLNKAPIEMTNYECTLMAGIPNAPSVYSLTENPALAEQRQKYVVRQMVKYGYITEDQAQSVFK